MKRIKSIFWHWRHPIEPRQSFAKLMPGRCRRRLICAIIAMWPYLASAAPASSVGYQEVRISNGTEEPLVAGIWYPSDTPSREQPLETFVQPVAPNGTVVGYRLPLVVISHGGQGSLAAHYDTALALARAGFVVAAVSHAGDTADDQSQVLKLWRRPAQLHRLISFMLSEWRNHAQIDPHRVGAFGFSNGGFTVLVAAGGVPDLRKVDPYCRDHPGHDLCQALSRAGVTSVGALPIPPDPWVHDPRIRAIVSAAPAFGFTFGAVGLRNVKIPVAVWRAADDRHQPDPWYDAAVRKALPRPPEYLVFKGAGHYDFLPPCSATLMRVVPQICVDPNGFDRAAFHQAFNAKLVAFFRKHLAR